MSLQKYIGFEMISDAASFQRHFRRLTSATVSFPAGRTSPGQACKFGAAGANHTYDTQVLASDNQWTIGRAWWCDELGTTDVQLLGALVRDSDNTVQASLAVQKGGTPDKMRLQVYRGDPATGTLLGETDYILQFGVWYYLELEVLLHNSTGTYEVRVNETNLLSGSGVDTQAQDTDQADTVRIGSVNRLVGGSHDDDMYILNSIDAGDGDNLTFLGDSVIEGKRPNADTSVQWTPSTPAADNYTMVDDADPDDDSTFNASTANNQEDIFGFENLAVVNNDNIRGIELYLLMRLTLSGTRNVRTRIKQGGTTVSGATHAVEDTAYAYVNEILERDPTDGNLWTQAKMNSVELGLESIA